MLWQDPQKQQQKEREYNPINASSSRPFEAFSLSVLPQKPSCLAEVCKCFTLVFTCVLWVPMFFTHLYETES